MENSIKIELQNIKQLLLQSLQFKLQDVNEKKLQKFTNQLAAELLNHPDDKVTEVNSVSETNFTGILKFNKQELNEMPKSFKKYFIVDGCAVCYRKRTTNGYRCSYEVRYNRRGYKISVSATSLPVAKARFIEALKHAKPVEKSMFNGVPTSFKEFSTYYFENYRKRRVAEKTYKNDVWRYEKYLIPKFGNMHIKNITPLMCQNLIDEIVNQGKGKTALEIFSLLNVILKMAIRHEIIRSNPLDIVFMPSHERKHGKSLTVDEERKLLNETANTPYQLMFAVALYTGMRPNEYKTAIIDGNFIKCVNSKQKDGKEHYKKIPIIAPLRPYLEGVNILSFYLAEPMRRIMREILPNHILYDLRTTFYTRCQECNVFEVARNLFVGHTLKGLASTYTDVSDEYLLSEAEKLNEWYSPKFTPNN